MPRASAIADANAIAIVDANADTLVVRALLARVARRTRWRSIAEGASFALALAAALLWLGIPEREHRWSLLASTTLLVAAGIGIRFVIAARRRTTIALAVEQRAPQCHNLLVTADELLSHPDRARPSVAALVVRQAATVIATLDPSQLFPARGAVMAVVGSGALWLFALSYQRVAVPQSRQSRSAAIGVPVIARIDALVTPPSYTARATQTLQNPPRIDALTGSRVRLTIRAAADTVLVETLTGAQRLPNTSGVFVADILADADGFIAVEPLSSNGTRGLRTLIGLSVTPDHAPRVRVTAPGRDLFLPNAKRTLDVAVDADDDIALATLSVHYTKVSGSGERFTFTEGTVPLSVTRVDDRSWKANAKWNLESLGLSAGDMVVYRAVASDKRPGAPPAESDSYIAELLAPGGDAAAGFALDTDQERYALSEQMVILKTEKLTARKATLSAEAMADEALQVAVEQRRVRAEFVFMMGGELAEEVIADASMTDLNEEAEAEGESDIAAGRLANQGRIALVRAIRAMSRAAAQLTTADLANALVSERTALKQLERAFAHTRILLRALTERERLDLSRRMTGTLTDVGRNVLPIPPIDENSEFVALRKVLARLAELTGASTATHDAWTAAAGQATELAERVLRVDPSSKSLEPVVATLQQAAHAFTNADRVSAHRLLDSAATSLTTVIRGDVRVAPLAPRDLNSSRLRGALDDARDDKPDLPPPASSTPVRPRGRP